MKSFILACGLACIFCLFLSKNSEALECVAEREALDDAIIMDPDFWLGRKCLENGLPWQVPASIYKEAESCCKEDRVLELGTGGSTIFLAKRCKHILAIETDAAWAEVVRMELERIGLKNVTLLCIPHQVDLESYLRELDTEDFNVFSVDTYSGFNRSAFINVFLEKPISDQLRMIILDNYGEIEFFPLHYDKEVVSSTEWDIFVYNDVHWVGKGTKICIRKK